jgi:hypothetical protein
LKFARWSRCCSFIRCFARGRYDSNIHLRIGGGKYSFFKSRVIDFIISSAGESGA